MTISLKSYFQGTVNAKSIGDVHSKSKKSLLGDNEAPEGFLGRLIHKKSLIDAGNSGINPEWVGDLSLNGILGPSENEGAFSRMDSKYVPMNFLKFFQATSIFQL